MPDSTMPKPVKTVVDEPPLKVRYLEGTSSTLVISFAGVGTVRSEEPPPEFFKMVSESGLNHVLFVSDIRRSWLNIPEMADRIVATIVATKARVRAERVIAVGNSMGAFSALQIAILTPVDIVVAFVPQYSVHPEIVPDETRWQFFRTKIETYRFPDLGTLPEPPTLGFVFHGGTPDEIHHWEKFPTSENIDHYIFPEMDHRVAQALKKKRILGRILSNAIAGRRRRVRQLVKANGGINRPSGE